VFSPGSYSAPAFLAERLLIRTGLKADHYNFSIPRFCFSGPAEQQLWRRAKIQTLSLISSRALCRSTGKEVL
jgi:hypothetical protein